MYRALLVAHKWQDILQWESMSYGHSNYSDNVWDSNSIQFKVTVLEKYFCFKYILKSSKGIILQLTEQTMI